MNLIKKLLLTALLIASANVFAREEGGDDAGNGGFAFKRSIQVLKLASATLETKIRHSTVKDLVDYPERRSILQQTLNYENLVKLPNQKMYRNGFELAMNYSITPAKVMVLNATYVAFQGVTDTQLEDASIEVQKRLLHEAAHIWGYNEDYSEKFANDFLENADDYDGHGNRPTNVIEIKNDFCACVNGSTDQRISDKRCDSFCDMVPTTYSSTLYINTILGSEIIQNPRLGNLYNWCNAQLPEDHSVPQCTLRVSDGMMAFNLPVNVNPDQDSFTTNIDTLVMNKSRTWKLRLVETKTGSNAYSKEFQIKNKVP